MLVQHSSPDPTVSFSEPSNIRFMTKASSVSSLLASLDDTVKTSATFEVVHVNEFTPSDRCKRYLFIRELEKGLSCNVFFLLTLTDQISEAITSFGKLQKMHMKNHFVQKI